MENDKSTKNKRILKGILAAALALCSIYSWTLPISSDFCKLSWIMKALTGGSILCGLAFYVIVIVLSVKNAKKNKKYYYDILYTSPLVVLEILNILSIFNYEIWGHKAVLTGLALVIIMFVELFASIRTIFKKSFGQENTPVTLLALTVVSLVLAAVNESAGNIEPANSCYKVCFGLAYLVAIALYTHQFIYKPKKPEKIVSVIIGIIFWGAAITITFPYYVQWCGLTDANFEVFVSVYAAVLGGGITLAGVAWTIKDANDKRQEDLKRIESERKEEERKKHIPYIRIAKKEDVTVYGTIFKIQSIDFEHAEDRKKLVDNYFVSIYRIIMLLKNISLNNIVLRGVYIDGEYYDLETAVLVEKGAVCKIEIGDKSKMYFVDEIKTIQLKISDIFDNTYKVEVIIRFEDTRESIEVLADGKTFYGNTKHYFIDGCKLPELIKEEEKYE